ncbi:glycosyl hydrolase [Aspergillus germanicus]
MVVTALAILLVLLAHLALAYGHRPENLAFRNPILPGFHPDPSCIFVPEWDDTFFCVTSSFGAFPGLPIYASKDLQNWKLIGNALNREEQLPELGLLNSTTGGIYAPTLRYKDGTFWLVTTLVHADYPRNDTSRWNNIIFNTKNPYREETWSLAVRFDFEGYDPSPFWDRDGQAYMVASYYWRKELAIKIAQINLHSGRTGPWETIWSGTGGIAPEGPHIYYTDRMYYLVIAEGGTAEGHMVTMARSRHLKGPYEANPANPVLTAANTTNFFQTVGHADLFQDAADNWWAVTLATREDSSHEHYPMGRESVLTPVRWEKGQWPVFSPVEGTMEGWPRPVTSHVPGDGPWVGGDDDVDFAPGSSLPRHFTYWRFPRAKDYEISPNDRPYTLKLNPSIANLTYDGASAPPGGQSFLGRAQEHTLFTFSVDMDYSPRAGNQEAGVTVFLQQNQHVEMGVVVSGSDNQPYLRVRGVSAVKQPPEYSIPLPGTWIGEKLHLEIKAFNFTHYSMSAGPANARSQMKTLAYVNNAIFGGRSFTGTFVGVYATSNGGNGTTPAYFSNWSYTAQGQFLD